MDLRAGERLFWLTDIGWIMGPWEIVGTLAERRHARAVRRRARLSRTRPAVGVRRAAPRERARRVADAHPRADGARRRAGPRARPLVAARARVDRRAVERGSVALVLRGGRRGPVPDHQHLRRHRGRRVLPLAARRRADVGVLARRSRARAWRSTCSTTTGTPVRGEVGELVCTKPWPGMTRGLFHDPQRYLDTYWSRWPDVWWHGDFASVSDDGQWFLHGRSDDTIKLAGKRLGPAEVETVVVAHPSVVEAAAIGVPDELKGEALWVFVGARPGCRRATTRCAPRSRKCVVRRARAVVQAGRRCGSRPRCRRRAARRCCAARSARS